MKILTRCAVLFAAVLILTAANAVRDAKQPLAPENESGFVYVQPTDPPTTEDFSSVVAEMQSLMESEKESREAKASEETSTARETTTAPTKPHTTAAQTKPPVKLTTAAKRGGTSGAYRITCYMPSSDGGKWGYATTTGVCSKHLATCAVDPTVIPLGSTVIVCGNNGEVLELLACDVGGCVKGKHVDIFFDGSEEDCRVWLDQFGEAQRTEIIPKSR